MEAEDETRPKRKRKTVEGTASGKRKRLAQLVDAEKERLEKLVLGDASFMLRNLGVGDNDSGVEDGYTSEETLRQPAWEDDTDDPGIKEDARFAKETRRRKNFANLYGQPSWAKLDREIPQEEDEDMAVIRTAGNFITKPSYLTKGTLQIKRLASLNNETRNEGPVIKCVEFHPTSTVALVAGLSGTASIFQVDGKGNNKLASIQFERFPIRCGHFSVDGKEFIVGSQKHSFFYVYDMIEGATMKITSHHNMDQSNMKKFEVSPDDRLIAVAGRFGQIHLLSSKSKEWIGNLSQNGNVTALSFSPDGSFLYSHSDIGEVYIWDMESRSLVTKFTDEGTIVGSAMAVSQDYLATGSSWGVVNLYDRPERLNSTPVVQKAFMNLVTQITSLKFNSSQQILAMASDEKENHIKMVHLPSKTVFMNFPSQDANIGRVQAFDFSPSSGYFSCVNTKSTAFLYRLPHYGSY